MSGDPVAFRSFDFAVWQEAPLVPGAVPDAAFLHDKSMRFQELAHLVGSFSAWALLQMFRELWSSDTAFGGFRPAIYNIVLPGFGSGKVIRGFHNHQLELVRISRFPQCSIAGFYISGFLQVEPAFEVGIEIPVGDLVLDEVRDFWETRDVELYF